MKVKGAVASSRAAGPTPEASTNVAPITGPAATHPGNAIESSIRKSETTISPSPTTPSPERTRSEAPSSGRSARSAPAPSSQRRIGNRK